MRTPQCLFVWLYCMSAALLATCNTEKAIFVGPEAVKLTDTKHLENGYMTPLNPEFRTLRTSLNASFPRDLQPKGLDSWFVLQNLVPGRRYEVRVCWLATQPTKFWLHLHTVPDITYESGLMESMSVYAEAQRDVLNPADEARNRARNRWHASEQSVLFLQIFAAADYFTTNKSLMENVPPVQVDIILDPFIFDVFPESLLWTAGYIVVLAISAWFISIRLVRFLQSVAGGGAHPLNEDDGAAKKEQ